VPSSSAIIAVTWQVEWCPPRLYSARLELGREAELAPGHSKSQSYAMISQTDRLRDRLATFNIAWTRNLRPLGQGRIIFFPFYSHCGFGTFLSASVTFLLVLRSVHDSIYHVLLLILSSGLLNPSGGELDLDPFNSKNRLSSISPFIVLLVLTMCDSAYYSSCSFYKTQQGFLVFGIIKPLLALNQYLLWCLYFQRDPSSA